DLRTTSGCHFVGSCWGPTTVPFGCCTPHKGMPSMLVVPPDVAGRVTTDGVAVEVRVGATVDVSVAVGTDLLVSVAAGLGVGASLSEVAGLGVGASLPAVAGLGVGGRLSEVVVAGGEACCASRYVSVGTTVAVGVRGFAAC